MISFQEFEFCLQINLTVTLSGPCNQKAIPSQI